MPQKKPTSVVVIAVMQIVFGAIGACGSLTTLSGLQQSLQSLNQQPQANAPGQPKISAQDVQKKFEEKIPNFDLIQKAEAGVGLAVCLVMIASGIGLLKLQPWGRMLAILYAFLSIAMRIYGLVFAFMFVMPAFSDLTNDISAQFGKDAAMFAQIMQWSFMTVLILGSLTVIYPVIVLIIMLRPAVRAAFRGETLPTEPEDYRDSYAAPDVPEPDDRFQG
jgi:hypothetical protein